MLTGCHHAQADPAHVIYMDSRMYQARQLLVPSKHSSDPGASLVLAALLARDVHQNLAIYTLRQSMNSGSCTVEKSAETQIPVPSYVFSPWISRLVVGNTGTRAAFFCGHDDSGNIRIAACSIRSADVVGISVPRALWEIPEYECWDVAWHITFDGILGILALATGQGHVWVLDFG